MKNKSIYILALCCLLISINLVGCRNNRLDLSKMVKSKFYRDNDYNKVIEIDNKVYISYSANSSGGNDLPQKNGIYECNNGILSLLCEGNVVDMHAYEHWIYYIDTSTETTLYRIDVDTQKIETILKGYSEYILCPAGIFFVEREVGVNQYIIWADLSGKGTKKIYISEKNSVISNIYIYANSIYFSVFEKSNLLSKAYYRWDMQTERAERLIELDVVKSKTEDAKVSDNTNSLMYSYEMASGFFGADNGDLYFIQKPIRYNPSIDRYLPDSEEYNIYKINSIGTNKIKLIVKENLKRMEFITANSSWLYYYNIDEYLNNSKLSRLNNDGNQIQTIVDEPCAFYNIINNYLYYSLLYDDQGGRLKNNLFRVNLDTLGKPEQLY